jgi:hypothetical protein
MRQDEEAAAKRKAVEDFGTGAIRQATDRLKREVESWSADPLAHARRRVIGAVEIAEQVVERVAASAPVLASESQRLLAENSELIARESSMLSNGGSEEEEPLSFWQKYGTRDEVMLWPCDLSYRWASTQLVERAFVHARLVWLCNFFWCLVMIVAFVVAKC